MADQSARQPFRFRIPWITTTTAPPAPRPPTATQPPTSARPPFRPPGVAPPRPTTTSSQAPPRNEPRPSSPAKIIPLQSRPSSSPIRTAPQPRVASQPPSNSTQSQPQATSQPPERTGPRPPSPSLITPKPHIASQLPSPPPTPLKSQEADQTSQNPTSLSRVPTQQEAETQKSTMPQLIKFPSPPQQPPRSSEPPPTRIATTSLTTSLAPPPQNLQPELNTPQPRAKIKVEKPIAQSQQEEKGPIPVVDQRNQASQLGLQGKVSDSNGEVVASGEEEKTLQKAADTNVHPVPLKEIRDNISKFAQRISDHPENITDENSVSVITLTGENTGATMKLGTESEQNESKIHIYRGYKLSQEDVSEATTDGENNPKRKSKTDTAAVPIYINSNTQSINNSILLNSSLTEGNPGVHVAFNHYRNDPVKSNNRAEARKADFNVTPSQKLTYEPTVKRRCLRGLMMELSDSDPENPDKPRRHGCRYDCKEKQKGRENSNDR